MLFNVTVWLTALLLALPIVVFTTVTIKAPGYYRQHHVAAPRKALYIAALVLCSICSLTYIGLWIWRLCGWYHKSVPLMAALTLERFMYCAVICSLLAIVCLAIGRGPHRILLGFSFIVVAMWLWHSLPILHWA